jgi:hypothetical protein
MPDDREFVRQVEAMRRLQREFFRLKPEDRPPSLIKQARAAEAAVDKALAEIREGQGTLFGGPP